MERFVAQSTAKLATQTLLKPEQLAAPVKMASLWKMTALATAMLISRMENARIPLATVVRLTYQLPKLAFPVDYRWLTVHPAA